MIHACIVSKFSRYGLRTDGRTDGKRRREEGRKEADRGGAVFVDLGLIGSDLALIWYSLI